MVPPELPTWQDCHELWSKKRRRQLREQQEVLPIGKVVQSKGNRNMQFVDDGIDIGGG